MHIAVFKDRADMTIAEASKLVWEAMRETGKPIQKDRDTELVTVVEIAMRDVINDLFEDFRVGPRATFTNSRVALEFHASISIYLKYSGNVIMTRRPSGPHAVRPRSSQWRLSSIWQDASDDTVLDRARQARVLRERDSENPAKRVLAAPREDDAATLIIANYSQLTAETAAEVADAILEKPKDAVFAKAGDLADAPTPAKAMPQHREESDLADPAIALQQIISERARLLVENKRLAAHNAELEKINKALRARNQAGNRELERIQERISQFFKEGAT